MLARVCILFTLVLSTNAFAETESLKTLNDKIEKASCDQFLTETPPPQAGQEPVVSSRWSVLGQTLLFNFKAIGQRNRAIEAKATHVATKAAYERYLDSLNESKRVLTEKWKQRKTSEAVKDPVFKPFSVLLDEKGLTLIQNASSEHQLQQIEAFLNKQRTSLLQMAASTDHKRKEAKAVFYNLLNQMKNSPHFDEVKETIDVVLQLMAKATSIQEVSSSLSETEQAILPFLYSHLENERLRKIRELRIDSSDPKQAGVIFSAFLSLNKDSSISVDKNSFVTWLESKQEARDFLYYELQTVRRLAIVSDQKAVSLRIENDLNALTKEFLSDDHSVAKIKSVRKSLLMLSHNSLFQGIEGAQDLKRTNMLEREILVRAAISLPEIQAMIHAATLDIALSLSPPKLPQEPPSRTPPEVPNIPRKARSQSHAIELNRKIARYNKDKEKFEKSWKEYNENATLYNDKLVPDFHKQVQQWKAALIRRHMARLSYVSFLSMHYSHLFSTPAVAEKIKSSAMNTIQQQTPKAAQIRTEATRQASTYDINAAEWLIFYYMLKTATDLANPELPTDLTPNQQDVETLADVQMPSVQIPEAATLDVSMPEIQIPVIADIVIPNIPVIVLPDIPNTTAVDIPNIPNVVLPSVAIPDTSSSFTTPDFSPPPATPTNFD